MIDRACISINAICNLDCPYCHFGKKKNNEKSKLYEFSIEEIDTLVNNLETYIIQNGMSTFKLGIVGSGEPMLSFPSIEHIVKRISNSSIQNIVKLYMITNGTIMEKKHLDFFFQHKDLIDVNFSLDGYEDIHNLNRMNYEKTFENTVRYEKTFGMKPRLNAVVTKESITRQNDLLKYFKDNQFNRVNFSRLFGVNDDSLEVTQSEYEKFLIEASDYGISNRQNNTNEKKYDCTKYGRLCGVGRTNIFITKQGIYPCARFMGMDIFRLGSFSDSYFTIENKLHDIIPVEDGQCFFEFHRIGQ